MRPTQKIQLLHIGCMVWFVLLLCEALWWRALPVWAGLAATAALYAALWYEGVMVRRLFIDYADKITDRSRTAARSMLMTRLLIGAVSVVAVAALLGRLGG